MSANVASLDVGIRYDSNMNDLIKELERIGKAGQKASDNMASSFDKSSKAVEKRISRLSNSFSRLGRTILAVFSIRQIFRFVKTITSLSSALTEVQNVVDTTFRESAYMIEDFSDIAIKSFGLSESAAKQYTSSMGSILKAAGVPIEQAAFMSIELTKLAADMASFKDIRFEEAFVKIQGAMIGLPKGLANIGYNLRVTALDAYAAEKGITTSFSKLDESTKALLRFSKIMELTTDVQGDFSKTSQTWANQLRLTVELLKAIGTKLGNFIVNSLRPGIIALNDFLFKVSVTLGQNDLFKETDFSSGWANAFAEAEDGADGLSDAYDSVNDAAKKASKGVASFDEVISLNKDSGIDVIRDAEVAIGGTNETGDTGGEYFGGDGGDEAYNEKFEDRGNILDRYSKRVIEVFNTLKEKTAEGIIDNEIIKSNLSDMEINVGNTVDNVAGLFVGVGESILKAMELESTTNAIANVAEGSTMFVTTVAEVATAIADDTTAGVRRIFDENQTEVDEALNNVSISSEKMSELYKKLMEDVSISISENYDEYVEPAIEQTSDGMSTIFGAVLEAYNDEFAPAFDSMQDDLDSLYDDSISPLIDDLGEFNGKLIALGADIGLYVVDPIVLGIGTTLVEAFSLAFESISGLALQFLADLAQTIEDSLEILNGFLDFMRGGISGDTDLMIEGVETIVVEYKDKVVNQVTKPFNALGVSDEAITDILDKINVPEWLKAGLNIFAPGGLPIGGIPQLATGGIVSSRTTFIAGESGGEAIIPLESSSMIERFADLISTAIGNNGGQSIGNIVLNVQNMFSDDPETGKKILKLITNAQNDENDRTGGRASGF